MAKEYKTINYKINGQQSFTIPISIKKNGEYFQEAINVAVKGFLKFSQTTSNGEESTTQESTQIYPVLFSTNSFVITGGRCLFTLLYRSEDLLEITQDIIEGASKYSDEDLKQEGVPQDESLTDNKEPSKIKIETGKERKPYWISVQITAYTDDGEIYHQTIDRGVSPDSDDTSDIDSLFFKTFKRTPSNFVLSCYNNEDWIPVVDFVLGSNSNSAQDVLDKMDDYENRTPFGMSTMYDAVVKSASLLSDNDLDGVRKLIYVLTDNEALLSTATVEDSIIEVNDIDGKNAVPVLIGNINLSNPRTVSSKSNSSDTRDLNKLSYHTGGQSITINSENYTNDIVGVFYREAVGAMGYGTYEFKLDFGEEVLINYISASFDVTSENSDATWQIETSVDGYNFIPVQNTYAYNESDEFTDLFARYVKFKVVLITGFSVEMNEYGAFPESPSLNSVTIIYNKEMVKYLYITPSEVEDAFPYHITTTVNANEINNDQIEVGIAKSDSINWQDYSTESQPTVGSNGKIVFPLRFSEDLNEFTQEPLKKIDLFTLKTEYGRFDPFDTVIIYDKDDEVISADKYSLSPRDGFVYMNYSLPSGYQDGDYKIGILHGDTYKIGIKIKNKTKDAIAELYGIGYVYTTSKNLLPPLSKQPPEARSVEFAEEVINKFSKVQASYVFYDYNFDKEDTNERRIFWYVNGQRINALDNLLSWNDISNSSDPFYQYTSLDFPSESDLNGESIDEWVKKQGVSYLNTGDKIYFEIQVTDGDLYSERVRSNTIIISASAPASDTISLKGKDYWTGEISNRISSESFCILYPSLEEALYSDEDLSQTEISWYVNGQLFKKKKYGDATNQAGVTSITINPNETGTENYSDYGLRIGNTIYCEIVPITPTIVGTKITTDVVTVQNTLPLIFNLDFISQAKVGTNLILQWNFYDFEVTLSQLYPTGQEDMSTVKWYRKKSGASSEFELIYVFNETPGDGDYYYDTYYSGHITTSFSTNSSTSTIDGAVLTTGQQWYAEIIPYDNEEYGKIYTTKILTIKD